MYYDTIDIPAEDLSELQGPFLAGPPDRRQVDLVAQSALIVVLLLAMTVLIAGWLMGNMAITHIAPGLAAMVPSTAFLIALCSVTLLARPYLSPVWQRRVMFAAATFICVVAIANIAITTMTGLSGIDRALFTDMPIFTQEKMSEATSFCFILVAVIFVTCESGKTRNVWFVASGTIGLFLSMLAIIVSAFDAQSLYQMAFFTTMALHTAACLTVIFLASLWTRRDRGWVAILDGQGRGSASARRLLPYCIILPIASALIINIGIGQEAFDPNFGLSLLGIVMMAVLVAIILRDANRNNKDQATNLDNVNAIAQLQASKDAVAESEANFRQLAEALPVGIFRTGRDNKITFTNEAMGDVLRCEPDTLLERDIFEVLDVNAADEGFLSSDGTLEEADLLVATDNEDVYTRAVSTPLTAPSGRANGHVGALIDMTENRRSMEALREARDDAQMAAHAKSSFLANMSHEIRTPMNGVLGFAELLIEGELDDEHHKYAQLILESGQSMVTILNDILDLSKIDAGQMEIRCDTYDLRHTIDGCVKMMRGAAIQKDIGLEVDFATDLPEYVRGDAFRLRQILSNLIGNAIKFTEKGHVRVQVRKQDCSLSVTVSDTGIGIPQSRQSNIFEEFVQTDDSIARRFGGTGLGLPISRKLAELMDGTLELTSAEGHGTQVSLDLPLLKCADPAKTEKRKSERRKADRRALPYARILVAEDNDINQVLIENLLTNMGQTVDMVNDGKEAIEAIEAAEQEGAPYPLVLMDVQMPHLDGLEATKRLRKSGCRPGDLPIIAVTANAYQSDIRECLDAGMQDHLVKPIRREELAKVITKWLVKSRDKAETAPSPAPASAG